MKAADYYKQKGYPELDKHDKKAPKFDYYELIEFAENYAREVITIDDVFQEEEEEKKPPCNQIYYLNNNRCVNCGAKTGHPCEL